jgi:hypothetical protein
MRRVIAREKTKYTNQLQKNMARPVFVLTYEEEKIRLCFHYIRRNKKDNKSKATSRRAGVVMPNPIIPCMVRGCICIIHAIITANREGGGRGGSTENRYEMNISRRTFEWENECTYSASC